jgi:hypothetical protein
MCGPAALSLARGPPGAAGMPNNESLLPLVNCRATPPLVFSLHALSRLRLMGLRPREVWQVVSDPEVVRPNSRGHDHGSYIAVGGRLAVVVARDPHIVLSVLWRWASGRDESGQPCGSRLAG